jgi:hypothetical protein
MLKCSSNAVSLRRSALVPCPLASALACRRRRRLLSSLARQRPHSPAVVVAVAALAVRPPPSPSRQPLSSSAATIIVATEPSSPSPPPPPPILCVMGKVPFHIQRNPFGIKQKQKKSIFIYGTTFKKNKFRVLNIVSVTSLSICQKNQFVFMFSYVSGS